LGTISCCEKLAYFKYTPVKARIKLIPILIFVACFESVVSCNNFYFLFLLFTTIHGSGRRWNTQLFLKAIAPMTDPLDGL
jgi:hypothetical protein